MYENLLTEALNNDVEVYEQTMNENIRGLYSDNVVWINKLIETSNEKACVLAEELGHYYTTAGDILDQSTIENRKQEKQARSWAYKKLVPLSKIVEAHQEQVRNKHELAEYLNVTEEFLVEALCRYKEEYGIFKRLDNYVVYFDPLAVMEIFK